MIDSHCHFYDPARAEGLAWPAPERGLPACALPADLFRAMPQSKQLILVETSTRLVDHHWLVDLAAQHPAIAAIVSNYHVLFDKHLGQSFHHADTPLRGVRLRPVAQMDFNQPQLLAGLKQLPPGSTVEAGCPLVAQKQAFARLAKQFDQLSFVLVHMGHPPETDSTEAGLQQWINHMQCFDGLHNIWVKITGAPARRSAQATIGYAQVMKHLQQQFSDDRLVWGSNWPVCESQGGHAWQLQQLQVWTAGDQRLRQKIFQDNAAALYRLN